MLLFFIYLLRIVGDRVVKETVRAVEEAEQKADQIMKKAVEEADIIVAEALENAKLLKQREKDSARAHADQALTAAKSEMKEEEELCNLEIQKEVATLKENASQNAEQAIEAVIAGLY